MCEFGIRLRYWGLMCSVIALLAACSGSAPCCQAFHNTPQFVSSSRRVAFLKNELKLMSSNPNEFDYILQEGGNNDNNNHQQQSNVLSTRRSRFAVKIGGGNNNRDLSSSKVIMVSSVAVPSSAAEAAEAMASMTEESSSTTTMSDDGAETSASSGGDVDPYDSAFDAQMNKIQQYQEKQQTNTMQSRLKSMDLQDVILTFILPSIALFAAARWSFNRVSERVTGKTDDLLESFANEMIFHDGDFEETKLCIADYNSKLMYLGPLKRDKMLKSYLAAYAKRKTISPQAIASLSYVFTQFKLSEEAAASILVSLCKELGTEKVSSAGKLLFLGSRILKSPEGSNALQPIRELIKSTYRDTDESIAETMVETSQQAMAEASYRTTVQAGGKKQKSLTDGWQVLGLEKAVAERIWNEEKKEGFATARETMYGGQTQKYDRKGRKLDKEGKLADPKEAEDEDDDDEAGPVSNVYECGDCGFTMFVAAGRESKFYGEGFKCPECGASKDKFKARDDFGED